MQGNNILISRRRNARRDATRKRTIPCPGDAHLCQIGTIDDRGPKPDTSILTHIAAHPADGFWLAVSSIEETRAPLRGHGRTLAQWKRREVARLGRLLPHPLPERASAQAQTPFWAGYCEYWDVVLKVHVATETSGPPHNTRTISSADTSTHNHRLQIATRARDELRCAYPSSTFS